MLSGISQVLAGTAGDARSCGCSRWAWTGPFGDKPFGDNPSAAGQSCRGAAQESPLTAGMSHTGGKPGRPLSQSGRNVPHRRKTRPPSVPERQECPTPEENLAAPVPGGQPGGVHALERPAADGIPAEPKRAAAPAHPPAPVFLSLPDASRSSPNRQTLDRRPAASRRSARKRPAGDSQPGVWTVPYESVLRQQML